MNVFKSKPKFSIGDIVTYAAEATEARSGRAFPIRPEAVVFTVKGFLNDEDKESFCYGLAVGKEVMCEKNPPYLNLDEDKISLKEGDNNAKTSSN